MNAPALRVPLRAPITADLKALERALAARIGGEVRFDAGSRALYASDASNYRQAPLGVVLPRNADDVIAALDVCRHFDVPLLMRGGGTSQNGQCVNVAVVIDTSKYMNRVLDIDTRARTALVEPGVVCDALRDAAERHGLTFGPDPATHSRCTLGGMIGNNSCGAHSVMAGKTVENIEALEILTYDGLRLWVGPTSEEELANIIAAGGRRGEIYAALQRLRDQYAALIRARYPKIKRRVSGYNLDQLLPENGFNVARALVGTEGTCALTLQARTKLVHSPGERVMLVLGYPDIYTAGDAVPEILPFGPIATEGLDYRIIGGLQERGLKAADIAKLPAGKAWIMIEFGADTRDAAIAQADALIAHYAGRSNAPSHWLVVDAAEQEPIWNIRETGASATALALEGQGTDPNVGWEDAAVDPLRLGDYLREFQKLVDDFGYQTSLYGHFGDGCIHARITFDLRSREGIAKWRDFIRGASELVVKYGGSLSGEHGDGQAKAEFLPIMYGEELMQAFREFKAIWDPRGRMNPGKVIDAYRIDENLRLGPDYKPAQPATRFAFKAPEGRGFTRALERCVGMGKCRAQAGGTMCPSYRATGEERHSTRGRARLLQEMLRGEVITDAWKSDAVREALDLCFACKGCRSDCPTHTDLASYKAEFLSHYYEDKPRPRQAVSMGLIQQWAQMAEHAPRVANFFTQTPLLNALAKKLAGVAPQRTMPAFATQTFRQWFETRTLKREGSRGGDRVILWADTFSNHFNPAIAIAAVEVLEVAGCEVIIPQRGLCCGRPLYDFGLLDRAKQQLADILTALKADIAAGTPVIGLEPACLGTFKDELLNFFPEDAAAAQLSKQAVLFSDFLLTRMAWQPRALNVKAIVHGHCHQKSLLGMAGETQLLKKLGVDFRLLNSGCCGMAGSFGFKPEHYEVSIAAGEKGGLLPAVRAAGADTLIITNGYSCREQIAQTGGRRALHIAEVARMALDEGT
jgi:FAD/FMN-containing dehydrogenase/Fe-S oxidoreductase